MREEALIFDRNDRVDHVRGHPRDRHVDPLLDEESKGRFGVLVVDDRGLRTRRQFGERPRPVQLGHNAVREQSSSRHDVPRDGRDREHRRKDHTSSHHHSHGVFQQPRCQLIR